MVGYVCTPRPNETRVEGKALLTPSGRINGYRLNSSPVGGQDLQWSSQKEDPFNEIAFTLGVGNFWNVRHGLLMGNEALKRYFGGESFALDCISTSR